MTSWPASLRSAALLGAAVAMAELIGPTSAGAGEPPGEAEQLFRKAQELRNDGNYAAACPKLARSLELDPALGTLLYLADCYEQIGRYARAYKLFKKGEQQAQARGDAQRRQQARAAAANLERRLSRLRLVPARPLPDDLELQIDGETLPADEWADALVDPGEHVLTARAAGREPVTTRVRAPAPGETSTVTLEALPLSAPTQTEPSGSGIGPLGIGALAAGGVALVATVVGIGVAVHAKQAYDDSDEYCRPDDVCQDQGLSLRDEAFAYARGADAGFVIGGLAAAAAIGLAIGAAASGGDSGDDGAAPSALRLVPSIGGLVLVGRW